MLAAQMIRTQSVIFSVLDSSDSCAQKLLSRSPTLTGTFLSVSARDKRTNWSGGPREFTALLRVAFHSEHGMNG